LENSGCGIDSDGQIEMIQSGAGKIPVDQREIGN
jgi:hypothetical protein